MLAVDMAVRKVNIEADFSSIMFLGIVNFLFVVVVKKKNFAGCSDSMMRMIQDQ